MSDNHTDPKPRTRKRKVLFPLLAVALGLAPFIFVELILMAAGLGKPDPRHDPFVEFDSRRPLFVLDESGERYKISPERYVFFCRDSFAVKKAADEFRVFCLGGSTVQGRPYSIETSFTTWLEIALEQADSELAPRVVNCGGISYASYRLLPILEETLAYEPDLIVVYTGHNEFLEERSYGRVKRLPAAVARPSQWLSQRRLATVLRGVLPGASSSEPRPVMPGEVEAFLDFRGGLEEYKRDESWRQGVVEHYRRNLDCMVQLAGEAGVPLVFVRPGSNLRDCPPFKSQHKDGLTPEQMENWKALLKEAQAACVVDMGRASGLIEELIEIDDGYAASHYLLGKCYDCLERTDEALAAYTAAKELDICPLRMIEGLDRALVSVAGATETPLVDARGLFRELSQDGIPGDNLFVDHVHPSIYGHRLIADLILEELARIDLIDPRPDWRERTVAASEFHLNSLDKMYYAQSVIRLDNLRGWSEGRAKVASPEK